MIDSLILKQYGAVEKHLQRGEMLFQEGDQAIFFYQILEGRMKMSNYNDEGQETLQGVFEKHQSFGEPALFGDFPFPANAEAIEKTRLICLEKSRLHMLLKDHFDIHYQLLSTLSKRLRYKAILSKEIKGHDAAHRIKNPSAILKGRVQDRRRIRSNNHSSDHRQSDGTPSRNGHSHHKNPERSGRH